jgi:hypothetical protein
MGRRTEQNRTKQNRIKGSLFELLRDFTVCQSSGLRKRSGCPMDRLVAIKGIFAEMSDLSRYAML